MMIKDSVFVYHLHEPDELVWHNRNHHHDSGQYEIHYFLEGEGSFLNGSVKYTLRPGSVYISPPGVRHQIEATDLTHPITYYAVLLQVEERDEEIKELFEKYLPWKRSYAIGDKFRFFFEEIREKALSIKVPLRKSAVYQLMSFLYLLAGDGAASGGGVENVHIEKALMFMQKNVFQKINLGVLAAQQKISEEHLIRLFKKKLNTTPMKYYTKLRIEAATSMLISSNMLIYQISEKLQFHSEFHFSKVFKQYTGASPKHYRNRYRQLIGEKPSHESVIYSQASERSG